jgi:hypothetical protein
MSFAENHGTRILNQILSSEGLAWIGEKVFDQLDGKSFKNCDLVCNLWRQFIINNGLWKRRYLHKLAKPEINASHGLIKANLELFQFDQAEQGIHFTHFALNNSIFDIRRFLCYSTLLNATLRYATLLYAILLYATLRYSTLADFHPHQ